MSLFQVRQWWTVKNGASEEFDSGCLAVGNADSEHNGLDKLVTGSFSGMLRVYLPRQKDFKIEDLLVEEQLKYPILQVAIGKFIAASDDNAIAVLHPRHLHIYTLSSASSASYYTLTKKFDTKLGMEGEHFTALNMTTGPFGCNSNSTRRDHIVVQSLDGRLMFFEQDSFAFMQQLTTCLVPGPIQYVPSIDAFVTATSNLTLECYKYQALATASCAASKDEDQDTQNSVGLRKKKKLVADWVTNIGEFILDIKVGNVNRSSSNPTEDIVILTEKSLMTVATSHGRISTQKLLGFNPSCITLYKSSGNNTNGEMLHNILIGTHTKKWVIYKENYLLWSAVSDHNIPISLAVTQCGSVPGMIVSMTDDGELSVNYLGTDPISTTVGSSESAKAGSVDYEALDAEHRSLLNVIRSTTGGNKVEPREKILLRVQVPELLDATPDAPEDFRTGYNKLEGCDDNASGGGKSVQLTIRVFVTYTGSDSVKNVTISVNPPRGVTASTMSVLLSSVDGKTSAPLVVPVTLYPATNVTPSDLSLSVSAAYTLETGQPRTSICVVPLPLVLACKLVPPVKASTFKFTIGTNLETSISLPDLFRDMLSSVSSDTVSQVVANNVLSFRYHNGVDVTILVSKNAGRYRIQSNELEALWLLTSEFTKRLAEDEGPSLEITYDEPLPLADFFAAIDYHFDLRKRQHLISESLNRTSHQFRVIQKRLLVRFKDRNPAALNHLDTILRKTYDELLNLANQMQEVQEELRLASNRLACSTSLVLMLIKLRFNLTEEDYKVLSSHMSASLDDESSLEHGWEESVDAGMTHLLRTVLAKKQTSSSSALSSGGGTATLLEMPSDTVKLKKHITIVCDRLAKGARLSSNSAAASKGRVPESRQAKD